MAGMSEARQIDIVRECIPLLSQQGQAVEQNLTAGLDGGEYPDLVFVASSGPRHSQPLIVEVKYATRGVIPDLLLSSAIEHFRLIQVANPGQLHFALAVNVALRQEQLDAMHQAGVLVFEEVGTGVDLAQAVLQWAKLPPLPQRPSAEWPVTRGNLDSVLERGETQHVEFKDPDASPKAIARTIAAFANSSGGSILLGVREEASGRGFVVGIEITKAMRALEMARTMLEPEQFLSPEVMEIGGLHVLVVRIEAAKHGLVISDNRVYQRRGSASVVATPREIEAALGRFHGLTLTFDTRLHRFDPTAFDAFIAQVLGPDTDVTIEERSNIDVDGPSFIRINGSRPEELVTVAEAFYERAWRDTEVEAERHVMQRAMSTGLELILRRLDHQRDHLIAAEENLGTLSDPSVREMLEDQATAHVLAKDRKLLHTRLQRISAGVSREARTRGRKLNFDSVQGEIEAVAEEPFGDDEG
jgi:hypothetical protein